MLGSAFGSADDLKISSMNPIIPTTPPPQPPLSQQTTLPETQPIPPVGTTSVTTPPAPTTIPSALSDVTPTTIPGINLDPTTPTPATATPAPSVTPVSRRRYYPSPAQVRRLTDVFTVQPSPPEPILTSLSAELGMPLRSVVLWFKNRRARNGRAMRESAGVRKSVASDSSGRKYVKSGIYKRGSEGMNYLESGVMDVFAGDGDVRGRKTTSENEEVFGELNPCYGWDCRKCEEVCAEFIRQKCLGDKVVAGGLAPESFSNVVQLRIAKLAAEKFFTEQFQCGFTLTSYAQDLETIMLVLEDVMNKTMDNETGAVLKSGVRAMLKEFVYKIRSGKAARIVMMKSSAGGGVRDKAAAAQKGIDSLMASEPQPVPQSMQQTLQENAHLRNSQ